ncbi:hypothetical protein DPEC_G00048160 [Dallia pectoralis]|uniref:Uncharacterized protein n=1 Tax=Dallia pectoralis TaxID=75939 RepID=A0ACC2HB21_DALPE|nr:hypothetical protein DPEC_G00048160 [Dallia pectoralis]
MRARATLLLSVPTVDAGPSPLPYSFSSPRVFLRGQQARLICLDVSTRKPSVFKGSSARPEPEEKASPAGAEI